MKKNRVRETKIEKGRGRLNDSRKEHPKVSGRRVYVVLSHFHSFSRMNRVLTLLDHLDEDEDDVDGIW